MEVLFIEPYLSGSHTQFLEALQKHSRHKWHPVTLPGRHWQARMATAAAFIANDDRFQSVLNQKFDMVVCSSFLNWVEFAGFRPQLGALPCAVYFHENQLAYMKDGVHSRLDWKFGFSQLTSALKANRVFFNSQHNMETFLSRARRFLRRFDDGADPAWAEAVRTKSLVTGYPVELAWLKSEHRPEAEPDLGPVIVWNHRWEADKNPADFFAALHELSAAGLGYRLIVCGGRTQSPEMKKLFQSAHRQLSQAPNIHILFWGYADSISHYQELIQKADIVVSTAWQEFFGVSVMEAAAAGATPVLPNRLAYRELYPARFLYNNQAELVQTLSRLCEAFSTGQKLPKLRSEAWQKHRAAIWCGQFDRLLEDMVAP